MLQTSIVRSNLMSVPDYAPYCGNEHSECSQMPRTTWQPVLKQFKCPTCGWMSNFSQSFIAEYIKKWGN